MWTDLGWYELSYVDVRGVLLSGELRYVEVNGGFLLLVVFVCLFVIGHKISCVDMHFLNMKWVILKVNVCLLVVFINLFQSLFIYFFVLFRFALDMNRGLLRWRTYVVKWTEIFLAESCCAQMKWVMLKRTELFKPKMPSAMTINYERLKWVILKWIAKRRDELNHARGKAGWKQKISDKLGYYWEYIIILTTTAKNASNTAGVLKMDSL